MPNCAAAAQSRTCPDFHASADSRCCDNPLSAISKTGRWRLAMTWPKGSQKDAISPPCCMGSTACHKACGDSSPNCCKKEGYYRSCSGNKDQLAKQISEAKAESGIHPHEIVLGVVCIGEVQVGVPRAQLLCCPVIRQGCRLGTGEGPQVQLPPLGLPRFRRFPAKVMVWMSNNSFLERRSHQMYEVNKEYTDAFI